MNEIDFSQLEIENRQFQDRITQKESELKALKEAIEGLRGGDG